MSERDEWSRSEYVSSDGRALALIVPAGLIPPPFVDMHEPEVGAIRFTYSRRIAEPTENS